MTATLPLLYTHVMGSHGFPGWFWTALDKIKGQEYGQTDVRETFDDATQLAIRDQERAGIDIVCDGEMRRFFFVQTFYGRMEGLESVEPLRKTGLYAYDSTPRYRPLQKIKVPRGLGIVAEHPRVLEDDGDGRVARRALGAAREQEQRRGGRGDQAHALGCHGLTR